VLTESACLQEMAVLFACMKTNDFNQSLCTKEIGTFQKCNQNYLVSDVNYSVFEWWLIVVG